MLLIHADYFYLFVFNYLIFVYFIGLATGEYHSIRSVSIPNPHCELSLCEETGGPGGNRRLLTER